MDGWAAMPRTNLGVSPISNEAGVRLVIDLTMCLDRSELVECVT